MRPRRILRLLSAFVLGLSAVAGHAADVALEPDVQEPQRPPLRDYFRERWTAADGLPHNLVADLVQTSEGYLWLATWEGVVRFNGRRFDVLDERDIRGLPDRGITELEQDGDGRLLIGTARGGVIRRESRGWTAISTDLGQGAPSVMSMLRTDSGLLVGTAGNGVLELLADDQLRQPVELLPLHRAVVYALAVAADGAIWIGSDAGVHRWTPGQLQALGAADGLPDAAVLSLLSLPDGDVLIGSERGLFRWRDGRAAVLDPALAEVSTEALLLDRHGDVWIGTAAHGLFRWGARGLEHLDASDGLPSNRVVSFLHDREDSIWVGTNAGLYRLRQAPFRSVGARQGLAADYTRSLLEAGDGGLWVATSAGLSQLDAQGQVRAWPAGALPRQSILSMARSHDGGLWLGTYYEGLLHWDPRAGLRRFERASGMPSQQIRAVLETGDGVLWAGTSRGLVRLQDGDLRVFTSEHGLPNNSLLSLHVDAEQRLWVGTTLGLAIAEAGSEWFTRVGDPALDGVQRVYGFNPDAQGALWVSTDRGVLRHHLGRWQRIGVEHGLPVAGVFSINQDALGDYWLSSNRGVIHLQGDSVRAVLAGRASRVRSELFSEADGMASAQCNGAAGTPALQRQDGSLWFATAEGVSWIDPQRLDRFPRAIPTVEIEQIRVDGEAREIADRIDIEPGARRVELEFVGLSFHAPQRIRYRYRLEGFDEGWVDSGSERLAQFTNLAPGQYRFRGSAANPNGDWSQHEAVVELRVLPDWWQRREVQLAAAVLLLGLLALGAKLRDRLSRVNEQRLHEQVEQATRSLSEQAERLREQNLELDAFAHTVAHDLKNPLSTVVGLARVLAQARGRLAETVVENSIARIHDTGQRMAGIVDALLLLSQVRSQREVDNGPLPMAALVAEVLQHLADPIAQAGAELVVGELPDAWGYRPWIEQVWANLIGNAVKYGGTHPRVEIGGQRLADGSVRYSVRDHGPGLDETARAQLFQPFSRVEAIGGSGHGLGLSIVRRIVERQGGEVGCDSQPGRGSSFWFRLPTRAPTIPAED